MTNFEPSFFFLASCSQRVDVHSEAASHNLAHLKRASLSSESANLSLDAKSAVVSLGDNASTKALAGSICNRCEATLYHDCVFHNVVTARNLAASAS